MFPPALRKFLPIAQRWGGEPAKLVEGYLAHGENPSTIHSSVNGSPPHASHREELALVVILEQHAAFMLERRLDRRSERAEQPRQQHLHADLRLLDIDRRLHRIAEGLNTQVKLVAGPAGLNAPA